MTLEELCQIIESRKKNKSEGSYIAKLLESGDDRVIQKVGEEATEVIIAAKNGKKKEIVSEVADLFFHTLVLLSLYNIGINDILSELEKRKLKKVR